MSHAIEPTAADRILSMMAGCFTADAATRLLRVRLDDATRARIEELANRNTEGELTEDERAEYETYVNLIDVLSLLQAKARRALQGPGGA